MENILSYPTSKLLCTLSSKEKKGLSINSNFSPFHICMGKSVTSAAKLQEFARVITSNRLHSPRHSPQIKPPIKARPVSCPEQEQPVVKLSTAFVDPREQQFLQSRAVKRMGETSSVNKSSAIDDQLRRTPLADVVADCVRRWFQDTLKEAKAGDTNMQVLVGQMYFSGFGIPKDAQKGKAWMNKASRTRASAWKVIDKRPGYNASDSDSDDNQAEKK